MILLLLYGERFGQVVIMNNKEKDLISIVIPCFNSGSTLERAINSARNQTWKNIEIIVVNDGSNEN